MSAAGAVSIAVLGDTHIKRTGLRCMPPKAYRLLERADLILHAGDLVVGDVLEDLRRFAPVHAVLGNNDAELRGVLPDEIRIVIEGVRIGMVHDSGPAAGRPRRLNALFPGFGLVVFGHSHIPMIVPGVDEQLLVNPGSPTDKRREPHFTMATFRAEGGRVVRPKLVVVDPA